MTPRVFNSAAFGSALLMLALLGLLRLDAQAPQPAPIREQDVAIRMRDGVHLRADILRPSRGRVPTLVYRTPYGKQDALKEYTTFTRAVERGYAVVVQDVRG